MPLLDISEVTPLPYWAKVAFIARCGRRLLPGYRDDSAEPENQRVTVARAIELAEMRGAQGGPAYTIEEVIIFEEQFYDHYDVEALGIALSAYVQAMGTTHSEVGTLADSLMAVCSLAEHAYAATFDHEDSNLSKLTISAADWVLFGEGAIELELRQDFETLRRQSQKEGWDDETPVDARLLGGP